MATEPIGEPVEEPTDRSAEEVEDARVRDWFEVGRIVNFNDAVFAIAMTLMVTNFRIPDSLNNPGEPPIGDVLRDQVPDLLGFLLTFAVLGHYWLAHHGVFKFVERADRRVLYLNLALVAVVVVMPYPTLLLQRYGDTASATITYAVSASLLGLTFAALWGHLDRTPALLDPAVPDNYVHHSMLRQLTIPVVFGLSIPVTLLSVRAGQAVWLLVIVGYALLRRRYGPIHHLAR